MPPLHIIRAHNGVEYRFYELSGDLQDALHFRHFGTTLKVEAKPSRIHIKGKVQLKDAPLVIRSRGRVRLRE